MTQRTQNTGEINALLGQGTEFEGKLLFDGHVRIDGKFSGQVISKDVLILGEGAEVNAEIEVGTLIIRGGLLRGNVRAAEVVEVYAPGKVYGNIQSPQLFIDKGVIFEGQCSMSPAQEEKEAPLFAQAN